MNSKTAKKLRKHFRREAGVGIDILKSVIRPRPKLIPKFIWVILFLPLFRIKDLKHIYKGIK